MVAAPKKKNAVIIAAVLMAVLAVVAVYELWIPKSVIAVLDPADPTLAAKLGITAQDWHDIQSLAAEEKGWVMMNVSRVTSELIEVTFKKPDDKLNELGGIFNRYEKKNGAWKIEADFHGAWTVSKVSLKR